MKYKILVENKLKEFYPSEKILIEIIRSQFIFSRRKLKISE